MRRLLCFLGKTTQRSLDGSARERLKLSSPGSMARITYLKDAKLLTLPLYLLSFALLTGIIPTKV
jgi:hypothetical protein